MPRPRCPGGDGEGRFKRECGYTESDSAVAGETSRAQAYYHLALASVYEDDAVSEGHTDEINQAIEQYKLALNADPDSAELSDDLADLYFRAGRVHDAETARAQR